MGKATPTKGQQLSTRQHTQRKAGGAGVEMLAGSADLICSRPAPAPWQGPGDSLPSFLRLLSWLNCSVNSVSDSSMVSVRGTESENLRLKFFILFILPCAARDGRALQGRGESRLRGLDDARDGPPSPPAPAFWGWQHPDPNFPCWGSSGIPRDILFSKAPLLCQSKRGAMWSRGEPDSS